MAIDMNAIDAKLKAAGIPGTTSTNKTTRKKRGENKMSRTYEKTCSKCGPFTTGGPRGNCPKCGKPPSNKKDKQIELKKTLINPKPNPIDPEILKSGKFVFVDFKDYPELLEDVKLVAKENFRSPEMQILSILHQVRGAGLDVGK